MYSRRRFLQTSAALAASVGATWNGFAQAQAEFAFAPERALISAPRDPSAWPAFRKQLAEWRAQKRWSLNYSNALYHRPDFAWVQRCFSCCFLMMCDQTFYDPKRGAYTVKAFLDHGEREFGGYDGVVLWHAYPRIGFDQRNQFDFYRDMPGGLRGLRRIVRLLQRRDVKVFINYNPWDTGTRREGKDDLDALVEIVQAIAADGIFLDTMDKAATEFRTKLDAARPGVALESELALPLERIHDHHLSWAQWFADSEAPGVLRNKWFERGHQQHQIKRWDRDHSGELHTAWMNGSGMMVWENVFGSWVGWNARDRSLLRAMLPIQRRFARLFAGEHWTPLVPTLQPNVYASEWSAEGLRLWTLINRSTQTVRGPLLKVLASGEQFLDLIAGNEATAKQTTDGVELHGHIPSRGIGCFLASGPDQATKRSLRNFLANQRALADRAEWHTEFPARQTHAITTPSIAKHPHALRGMVEIPAARYIQSVELRVRECGFYESSPERGPVGNALHRTRTFTREITLSRYAMDLTPVTNGQFAEFLKASRYRPRHAENFLRHWVNHAPPPGQEDHPVVYVDLDDARAYARWAGKRLPTEEEWQCAAEGPGQNRFPWGNEMRPNVCNDGTRGDTTGVMRFPAGRSAFGCYDLCGNIWHWTESERSDGRTRFCMLKGGSWFQAQGSAWYADGGPQPCRFAAKFLLLWPGLDRCSTIGFRCVADLT